MNGIPRLNALIGYQWLHTADTVTDAARKAGLSVNVIRPVEGVGANIDVNPRRLNVYLDEDFRIVRFNIG